MRKPKKLVRKIKSLYLFPNGNVAAFDEGGEQISLVQKIGWLTKYLIYLRDELGFNIMDIEEIVIPNGLKCELFITKDNKIKYRIV